MAGRGRIYRRGRVWWVSYNYRGQTYRESSGDTSDNAKAAKRLLARRLGAIALGQFVSPEIERKEFNAAAADLINDYRVNNRRSLGTVTYKISNLRRRLGRLRLLDITEEKIRAYIIARRDDGAKNSTINRELAALSRMMRLARIPQMPRIAMLTEDNARQGFVDVATFAKIRAALPADLRGPVEFLYLSGWRPNEMRTLKWRDVEGDAIRLRPEHSKNRRGRELPLRGELARVLDEARTARGLDCPYVFHRGSRPVGKFYKTWARACSAAGVHGLLIYDLRRSAVRNLVRAGVPERVAMGITGHRTRSVFDRYNIVSANDLVEAIDRVDRYLKVPQPEKVAQIWHNRRSGGSKQT